MVRDGIEVLWRRALRYRKMAYIEPPSRRVHLVGGCARPVVATRCGTQRVTTTSSHQDLELRGIWVVQLRGGEGLGLF